MKTLYYDGVAAVTDDEVADAVLELALAVARYRQYEAVTFPVLVDGATQRLTVMLGPTIHLSAITVVGVEGALEGVADAVRGIGNRLREITEPLRPPVDFVDLTTPVG